MIECKLENPNAKMFIWFNSNTEEYCYGSWVDYINMIRVNPPASIHILERVSFDELGAIENKIIVLNKSYKSKSI